MKVFLGSDHGGFALKEALKKGLGKKHEISDFGCSSQESCDYPDFAVQVAKAVAESNGRALGVLCCGTGLGMSMAANKVKGIRAAVVYDEFTAKMARQHNNANIACLGGRNIEKEKALRLAKIFLATAFLGEASEGERHLRRVKKIAGLEKQIIK